jgi:hypothetical protein
MENKTLSNKTAGLILFLVMAVYSLIINLNNLQANTSLSWISYVIVVAGIIIFVTKYGKDKNGNVTFGNLFAYGFKITAVLIIFFIAFMIIFYMVFPEYKEKVLEIGMQKAMQNANASQAESIKKGMEIGKQFFWVGLIAGITFSFAILGLTGSLLGAALTKKNPVNPFQQQTDQIA